MTGPKVDKGSPFAALKNVKLAEPQAKPVARPAPNKQPKVTAAEEEIAFHRLMQGVTPLDAKAARVPTVAPVERTPRKTPERARAEDDDASMRLASLASSRFEVVDDGVMAEGRLSDISPDVMRKLRRAQLPVDARLDLHGLSAAEARDALVTFLRKMRAQGERCVLVIHGKGLHSPGGAGVLRGEMSAWLSQGAAAASVAAFASQADADGASGAMLVLLRR
jgi:hypothetical protein